MRYDKNGSTKKNLMEKCAVRLPAGTVVVNLTPHELFFHHPGHDDTDKDGNTVENAFIVPPSGITADATATETAAGERGGAALVKTVFPGKSRNTKSYRIVYGRQPSCDSGGEYHICPGISRQGVWSYPG